MLSGSVLFYGPPGCGKSLFVRACFGEAKEEVVVRLNATEILLKPEEILKDAFEGIKRFCIRAVIVDDIDSLFTGLRSHASARIYLIESLKAPPNDALILATARKPESLLPEELDAFAGVVPILYPDPAGRLEILRGRARGTILRDSPHLPKIAERTKWWSGRELDEFISRAASGVQPFSDETLLDLLAAIQNNVSTDSRKKRMQELLTFTWSHCTSDMIKQDLKSRFSSLKIPEEVPAASHATQIHIREIVMGDQYKVGQAAAVGRGAHARDINFTQSWQELQELKHVDDAALAKQLSSLRAALLREASAPEHYVAIGTVASAESEAANGNGAKALEYLSKVGRWVFETATKIGETVAAEAIKKAMGL